VLKCLLNLSTIKEGQKRICKALLRRLLDINAQPPTSPEGFERIRLSSGLLTNLSLNPDNRTRFYKEEIRLKSKV
jgi:hypothetical protein